MLQNGGGGVLVTIGSVYSVHVKETVPDKVGRLTSMGCWPTVYDSDGLPSDSSDYTVVVYWEGDHGAAWEVMDVLKCYGATSCRWLSDFFREV